MNGTLVNWDDANIHVLSHVVTTAPAGSRIRCYDTAKGPAIFRLDRHVRRLFDSMKIYRTPLPYTQEQVEAAILETIRANRMRACYIRPVAYRGYGDVGVNPLGCPVDLTIAVWEWGSYLGADALANGIDVCVSTWNRPAPNTLRRWQGGGNYILADDESRSGAGWIVEAIALDVGNLSEEAENLFLVHDGILLTPPFSSALLPGITRLSIINLRAMGYEVREMVLPARWSLWPRRCSSGTAAEVTPIRSVDRTPVGSKPGPVTMALQKAFSTL
jgi:branched-chain amino acid aminotransferase